MKGKDFIKNSNYFISFTDLAMGLLFFFIFMFIGEKRKVAKIGDKEKMYKELLEKEKNYEKINIKLKKMENIHKKLEEKLKNQEEKEKNYKKMNIKLKKMENMYQVIDNTYDSINNKLIKTFGEDKIDTEKRELKLDSSILFDTNSSVLKEDGKNELRKVLPVFFKTFIDDAEILKYLEQLTIEGHTDDTGNYLYNLGLSQNRAYAVSYFIYNDPEIKNNLGSERLEKVKIFLSSNGKGDVDLIYKDTNNKKSIDREKSRRVSLKYKLNIEKMITK